MPGNFNGDDTITKLTQEQIEILTEKHYDDLVMIGAFAWSGDLDRADHLAEKILIEEGFLVEDGSY